MHAEWPPVIAEQLACLRYDVADDEYSAENLIQLFNTVISFIQTPRDDDLITIEALPGRTLDSLNQKIRMLSHDQLQQLAYPADTLENMQIEVIDRLGMDDARYLLKHRPAFIGSLFCARATLIASAKDEHIGKCCKPKLLKGAFSPLLLRSILNAPFRQTLKQTAEAILALKEEKGVDALLVEPSYIMKARAIRTDRTCVVTGQEPIREQLAYELQSLIGIDFGVPPTIATWMDLGEGLRWCSVQQYEPFCRHMASWHKAQNKQLLKKEFQKFIFDLLIMASDRHFLNVLVDPKKASIKLIDNGLSLPMPCGDDRDDPYPYGLLEARFDWMRLELASEPFSDTELVQHLLALDVDDVLAKLAEKSQEIAVHSKGQNDPLSQETLHILRLNFQLVIIGAKIGASMREIAATCAPVLDTEADKLRGGEIVSLYEKFISKKNTVNWEALNISIENIIKTPLNRRQEHPRNSYFNDLVNCAATL